MEVIGPVRFHPRRRRGKTPHSINPNSRAAGALSHRRSLFSPFTRTQCVFTRAAGAVKQLHISLKFCAPAGAQIERQGSVSSAFQAERISRPCREISSPGGEISSASRREFLSGCAKERQGSVSSAFQAERISRLCREISLPGGEISSASRREFLSGCARERQGSVSSAFQAERISRLCREISSPGGEISSASRREFLSGCARKR